ncbi:DUF885 family protein, partial [Kineococcus glutinatus]|uniref:DUF885 family protein n=1 Tax=Kineococcus glutinatus TaxID=1070872 RepID=UPI0031E8D291
MSEEQQPTTRPRSAADDLAEEHFAASLRLQPLLALSIGAPAGPGLGDHSPAGTAAVADLARATLARLGAVEPADDVDRTTLAALRERLGLEVELFDAGELTGVLNVIASPLQELRMVFDLLPTDTAAHWEEIADRLAAVPAAVDGYVEGLRAAAAAGRVAA